MSGTAFLYLDDINLSYEKPANRLSDGNYYLWNSSSDAFTLLLSNSGTSVIVGKLGSVNFTMDCAITGETVSLHDDSMGGSAIVIEGNIIKNDQVKITSVSGSYAEAINLSDSLLNKTFKRYAPVSLDFSDGAGEGKYTNSHWTMERWGTSSYEAKPLDMNSRKKNENKNVNLPAEGNGRKYIYTPDLSMGPVNHIELDLGNYYSDNVIQYKIAIVDGNGNSTFATASGADTYVQLAYGSDYNHISLDFTATVGAKLIIFAKCSTASSYLYVDNIALSYQNS